jgi:predicted  nucleic acid-binding Zn-ribbon protein
VLFGTSDDISHCLCAIRALEQRVTFLENELCKFKYKYKDLKRKQPKLCQAVEQSTLSIEANVNKTDTF